MDLANSHLEKIGISKSQNWLSGKSSAEKSAGVAQLIERSLAKAEVAGLSPVSRSNFSFKLISQNGGRHE